MIIHSLKPMPTSPAITQSELFFTGSVPPSLLWYDLQFQSDKHRFYSTPINVFPQSGEKNTGFGVM